MRLPGLRNQPVQGLLCLVSAHASKFSRLWGAASVGSMVENYAP